MVICLRIHSSTWIPAANAEASVACLCSPDTAQQYPTGRIIQQPLSLDHGQNQSAGTQTTLGNNQLSVTGMTANQDGLPLAAAAIVPGFVR